MKKVEVTILMPDEEHGQTREVQDTDSISQMQGMVGGYVELVRLAGNTEQVMIVDEDAQMKGKPLNRAASEMIGQPVCGPAALVPARWFDPTPDAPEPGNLLRTVADEQGWSRSTQIDVCVQFIEDHGLREEFADYIEGKRL